MNNNGPPFPIPDPRPLSYQRPGERSSPMLPLFVDLQDRLCLVIGAGAVGCRKALALLEAGASVRLVGPLTPADSLPSPRLDRLPEPYHPRHLDGVCLVIAAATPEVNRQVVADARARGL